MQFDNNISIFMNNWEIKQNIRLETFYFEEYIIPGVKENFTMIKVFVVFSDEKYLSDFVNKIYQLFRKWFFGSRKDMSPIYILTTQDSKEIIKIFYESSEEQNFFDFTPKHYEKVHGNNIQELNFYASTWNHLFLLTNPSSKQIKDSDISKLGEWKEINLPNGWKKIKSEKIKNKEKFGRRFGVFNKFVMDQLKVSKIGREFAVARKIEKEVFPSTERIFKIDINAGKNDNFLNFIREIMVKKQIELELELKPQQVRFLVNSIIEENKTSFYEIQKKGLKRFFKNMQKI